MHQHHLAARSSHSGTIKPGTSGLARHVGVRVMTPLLVLWAMVSLAGTALASGAGPGIGITPAGGPVGAHVTVTGNQFTSGDAIQVGYATGNCAAGITIIAGASGTVGSGGTIKIPFTWPQTAAGNYTLCAHDTTNGHSYSSPSPFQVTSPDPPTISVSGSLQSSQPITVTGAHFLLPGGGTAEVRYGAENSNGCATAAGTSSIGADGSFSVTFNAPFESSNTTIVITAVDPQGSCGGQPTLDATTSVTVRAAPSPTPTPSPTAAPTATPGGQAALAFPPSWPPSGPWTVVYCLIGLLLLLLLLLLALLLTRRRRKDQPATTIKQQDTPVVNAGGGPMGVQSRVYAESPRGQRQTPIWEETIVREEPVNPQNQPGQAGQPSRNTPPNAGGPGGA